MAWDEWEQLKAEAQERTANMQLNQASSQGESGGGGQGDLAVDQQDLAAIGDSAFKLFEDLGRYGRDAWSSSQTAAKNLTTQEFELGSGLDVVQKKWEKQLQSLVDACAHISNHMEFTKKTHQGDEYYIASRVSSIATLGKGFDEESKP
ncbi:hypothetical protein ACFYSH_18930 [Streptomyces sp. NPDC005791]|uniref:hypothetical protein n=1 Tax=Streptomyces sp. NPDC005791 TaxID=3364732 RepID=UPI00368762EB